MLVTSIDPTLYLKSTQQTRSGSGATLGKDEFLKILMTQLQNQDPTNPMKDKEFISQMASFSSLEQMTNMSGAIEKLTEAQSFAPVVKYSAMIGKDVSYEVRDENGNVTGIESSTVDAVTKKQGSVLLELSNGEKIDTNHVVRVSNVESK